MIVSFRHKGLRAFFETDSKKGIQPAHAEKLQERLTVLNIIRKETDIPRNVAIAWKLHPLRGELKDHFSISVSGNWRITFTFEDEDVALVDYQDYH
ncbi:MAG TPA: type II toxin-antitoxin system RelE/ParE family toxin [Acidobacteriaceae bacterium]|nr:type II toxin-antitoxin system RelE/ParE family toxin [Acidobacteriaceae bacterium]